MTVLRFQAVVWIEPHERFEAVSAYQNKLNNEQIETILDAPDGALIRLDFKSDQTTVMIIEEG